MREKLELATRYRWQIIESGDDTPQLLKEQKLKLADEAERLIVFGFFAEVLDRIDLPEVREGIERSIEAELRRAG